MKEIIPLEMVCVHAGDRRAALIIDWGAWLPAELNPIYAREIDALRARGRKVAQIRNFHGNAGLVAVRHLFSRALGVAYSHGAHDIITVCAPRSARGYRTFGFEDMLADEPPRV